MNLLVPALDVNLGLTVTNTLLVSVQPLLSVTVSVYFVVVAGPAVGLAEVVEFKPVDGVQLYCSAPVPPLPEVVPPIFTELP